MLYALLQLSVQLNSSSSDSLLQLIYSQRQLTAVHCIALHCTALHCIALHCIALHCIALHCIALHYIVTRIMCCSFLSTLHYCFYCIALHCIAVSIALHCILIRVYVLQFPLHWNLVGFLSLAAAFNSTWGVSVTGIVSDGVLQTSIMIIVSTLVPHLPPLFGIYHCGGRWCMPSSGGLGLLSCCIHTL